MDLHSSVSLHTIAVVQTGEFMCGLADCCGHMRALQSVMGLHTGVDLCGLAHWCGLADSFVLACSFVLGDWCGFEDSCGLADCFSFGEFYWLPI